jgi:hypothetical protein
MILNSLSAIVGAAAIVPALLVLWLVIVTDRRPEPPRLVWTTFLLGVGSIFLLRYARLPFEPFLHITDSPSFALPLHVLFGVAMPQHHQTEMIFRRLRSLHQRAATSGVHTPHSSCRRKPRRLNLCSELSFV